MSEILDKFFNLGSKATKGDPVKKALFDYILYWIVFITFLSLSINYFFNFIKTLVASQLMWGVILCVFCWFNYWALISFRTTYQNMLKFYSNKNDLKKDENDDIGRAFDEGTQCQN